jgi:hypothetical protein
MFTHVFPFFCGCSKHYPNTSNRASYCWVYHTTLPRVSTHPAAPFWRMRQAIDGRALEIEIHGERCGDIDAQDVILQFRIPQNQTAES